jgi:hypothetical protein
VLIRPPSLSTVANTATVRRFPGVDKVSFDTGADQLDRVFVRREADPRTEQLAPGFRPMLGGFLASVGGRGPAD